MAFGDRSYGYEMQPASEWLAFIGQRNYGRLRVT